MGVKNPVAPWTPVLLRSAAAAVYGLLSIFWPTQDTTFVSIAGGLYLLVTGVAMWRVAAVAGAGEVPGLRPLLLAESALYAVAGILTAALQDNWVFALAGGAALAVGGIVELMFWIRARSRFLPARDWLITGVTSIGAAVLLPVMLQMGLDARALLGVSGGSAVIIAVILATSGFGARHDARQSAAPRAADAVN